MLIGQSADQLRAERSDCDDGRVSHGNWLSDTLRASVTESITAVTKNHNDEAMSWATAMRTSALAWPVGRMATIPLPGVNCGPRSVRGGRPPRTAR
jgi:hypothetical protein